MLLPSYFTLALFVSWPVVSAGHFKSIQKNVQYDDLADGHTFSEAYEGLVYPSGYKVVDVENIKDPVLVPQSIPNYLYIPPSANNMTTTVGTNVTMFKLDRVFAGCTSVDGKKQVPCTMKIYGKQIPLPDDPDAQEDEGNDTYTSCDVDDFENLMTECSIYYSSLPWTEFKIAFAGTDGSAVDGYIDDFFYTRFRYITLTSNEEENEEDL